MTLSKQLFLLCLVSILSLQAFSNSKAYNNDTLNIRQIDSVLRATKRVKSEKTVELDESSVKYYIFDTDKGIFLAEVSGSIKGIKCTTKYYFIQDKVSKVIYKQRNKDNPSTYYFSNDVLLFKNLNQEIHTPDVETVLLTAKKLLKEKS